MLIPTNPPHPDWLPPKPRRSRWWLGLFVPAAPVAGYLLPASVVVAVILLILVVIRYSDTV
ncbi:MAG: hypothetical protein M3434_12505 [Gemmatimonadota bacterium]|jgi:hypothetical protein|nr:hypothetical protein [Gemmatimonadota bacterium]